MEREFLGAGWKFPVYPDASGKIRVSRHEEDIRESICIIIGTAPGERIMRPLFGCGINRYVFATVNMTTLRLIENTVREALVAWEPRIDVLGVSTDTSDMDNGRLLISIDYQVRSSNARFNLVYPFYLREG
jgi:phage baseplate assembly protein W